MTLKASGNNITPISQVLPLVLARKFSREFSNCLTIQQLREPIEPQNSLENLLLGNLLPIANPRSHFRRIVLKQ